MQLLNFLVFFFLWNMCLALWFWSDDNTVDGCAQTLGIPVSFSYFNFYTVYLHSSGSAGTGHISRIFLDVKAHEKTRFFRSLSSSWHFGAVSLVKVVKAMVIRDYKKNLRLSRPYCVLKQFLSFPQGGSTWYHIQPTGPELKTNQVTG